MDIKTALNTLLEGQSLPPEAMQSIMESLMTGELTSAQIAGFLIALRAKGETVDEVVAAARVLRRMANPLPLSGLSLVDTCGTGGDGAQTFNISTASALVAAAAGALIAKHGGRSVSSHSGSADVLEAAGVTIELDESAQKASIETLGIGFLFAQHYHLAMRHVAPTRRELGVRTLFNLLGPLTNPAGARRQVIGVYGKHWVPLIAEALHQLGSEHALVVHAEDGLDEISIAAPTFLAELKEGKITTRTLTPEQLGLQRSSLQGLKVESAKDSLALILRIFNGERGPAFDIVSANAGAAIYVAGLSPTLEAGVALARETILDGSAHRKLDALVAFSRARSGAKPPPTNV